MRTTLFFSGLLAVLSLSGRTYSQGQLVFSTRVAGQIDAPLAVAGIACGPGPFYTAQLFLSEGGSLTPLLPATTFRLPGEGPAAIASHYVVPVDITVPGIPPGATATFVAQAWPKLFGDYTVAQKAGLIAVTPPVTITLGGGLFPPANLVGLQGWSGVFFPPSTVPDCIPEPSTLCIGALGIMIGIARSLLRP